MGRIISVKLTTLRSDTKGIPIFNNYWIIEPTKKLIPFVDGHHPGSFYRQTLVDEIHLFFGLKFKIVHLPIAYIPKRVYVRNRK